MGERSLSSTMPSREPLTIQASPIGWTPHARGRLLIRFTDLMSFSGTSIAKAQPFLMRSVLPTTRIVVHLGPRRRRSRRGDTTGRSASRSPSHHSVVSLNASAHLLTGSEVGLAREVWRSSTNVDWACSERKSCRAGCRSSWCALPCEVRPPAAYWTNQQQSLCGSRPPTALM